MGTSAIGRRKRKKSFSARAEALVTYGFKCPECEKDVQVTGSFTIRGGCLGHGPDEYCYCDSPHIEQDVTCPNCGAEGELRVGW
jgi:transcription elongation factor Elf1